MIVSIVIFSICIILSAFFSSSETVYAVVNRLRLKKDSENGNLFSKVALDNVEKFDVTTSTILLGNNLVNIAASIFGANIFNELLAPQLGTALASTLSAIIVLVILLVLGEIFPKVLGMRFSFPLSKLFAIIIKCLKYLFFPIVMPISKLAGLLFRPKKEEVDDEEKEESVTDDELIEMAEAIEEEGLIDESQLELVKSAIDFTDITAYEIMTPRVDVFGYDINDDISELTKNIEIFSHSRIPVYDGSLDNIIGVVKSIEVLKLLNNGITNIDINDLLEEPYYVPESKQISSILEEFKSSHHHLAIVKDEYGGTAGILTLEDIVEELVGDIWDEMDTVEEDYIVRNKNEFLVDGSMNIEDFFNLVDLDIDDYEGDSATVNGWCQEELGRFAKVNDTFEYKNLSVLITKADEFTVEQIKVTKKLSEEE